MVTLDDWRSSTRTEDNREWRGFTLFKVENQQEEGLPVSSSATRRVGTRDATANQVEEEHQEQEAANRRSTRSTTSIPQQTSSYEGIWRSAAESSGSRSDTTGGRVGSRDIPPIQVNVTVHNQLGNEATTSRRSSMTAEAQRPLGPRTLSDSRASSWSEI